MAKRKFLGNSKARLAAGRVKRAALRPVGHLMHPIRSRLRPRRFQAYCVGAMKSGTTSLGAIFPRRYRAAHEPDFDLLIDRICSREGRDEAGLVRFFRTRDRRLWLEQESSHMIGCFVDVLVKAFDGARFILTIRDCYTWLDSLVNWQLSTGNVAPHWVRLYDAYYRPDEFRAEQEQRVFGEYSGRLYSLDGYLSFWGRHNRRVLAAVPTDRLLVVRTHEISQSVDRIARFLDVPASTLDGARSHSRKNSRRWNLLSRIDRRVLEEKVDLHCRDLMSTYFPELSSLEDAGLGS